MVYKIHDPYPPPARAAFFFVPVKKRKVCKKNNKFCLKYLQQTEKYVIMKRIVGVCGVFSKNAPPTLFSGGKHHVQSLRLENMADSRLLSQFKVEKRIGQSRSHLCHQHIRYRRADRADAVFRGSRQDHRFFVLLRCGQDPSHPSGQNPFRRRQEHSARHAVCHAGGEQR